MPRSSVATGYPVFCETTSSNTSAIEFATGVEIAAINAAALAAIVDAVGEETDLWQLPALAYTKSNEHAWSSGTIWLSATTLLSVLDDIGRSVAMTPARRLVFMNGHGGNSTLVGTANRELRLKQEYFFVAASIQDLVERHLTEHPSLANLADKVAIHLNDTHPAIGVAELMRVLCDVHNMDWDTAWAICKKTFSYTNHTLMPEALETWPVKVRGTATAWPTDASRTAAPKRAASPSLRR